MFVEKDTACPICDVLREDLRTKSTKREMEMPGKKSDLYSSRIKGNAKCFENWKMKTQNDLKPQGNTSSKVQKYKVQTTRFEIETEKQAWKTSTWVKKKHAQRMRVHGNWLPK